MKKLEKIIFAIALSGIIATVGTGVAISVTHGGTANYCEKSECDPPNYHCIHCEAAKVGLSLPDPATRADMFFRLGQLEKERTDNIRNARSADSVYIRSADFVIYQNDLNISQERFRVMGTVGGLEREQAVQEHLRYEIWYAEAKKHGFDATEKEIREFINNSIETMSNSMNFEDDVVPFLKGAEMTLEEYWESRSDIIRGEIATSKYCDWLRMSFYIERGYVDNSGIIRDYLESDPFCLEVNGEMEEIFRSASMSESEWQEHLEKMDATLMRTTWFTVVS